MDQSEKKYSEKYSFLYSAINDTQEIIRFTDTKSGAVIVVVMGLIAGVVTLIDKYYTSLKQLTILPEMIAILGVSYFLVCLFISLILSLRSINPANDPNHHIDIGDWLNKPKIKYYLCGMTPTMRWEDYLWELEDLKFSISASEYYKIMEESENTDILKALIMELLKLSYIREKKMQRTKAALIWLEQCICTAALTIIMVLVTYYIEFSPSWSIKNQNYNMFLYLIVGHIVGDFLLQTNWQVENKNRISIALIIHSLVYVIVAYLFSLIAGGLSLISIAVICFSHALLDKGDIVNWWLKKVKKEQTDNVQMRFLVDQSLHVLVLFIVTIIN
ncbi:DUF3307 domain-containing protein [Lutispora saccharofermentans]|uniref:DUF3307 domain-containing protein n=1 Tax=Lutispora saccharofermentans TaxID=3024236 RepID=A0ABT1NE40_9FIRM|nr:DUF3307 domain-containing protein [Lutispora saccharofermentans]MCQ1529517.1 DUF3307 domain-containing protein [Lutispora saccharofermentans]